MKASILEGSNKLEGRGLGTEGEYGEAGYRGDIFGEAGFLE